MTPLEQVAIEELPAAIAYLKQAFAKQNPDAPEPPDEDVILAYNTAYKSSVAKDDAWTAAHPE